MLKNIVLIAAATVWLGSLIAAASVADDARTQIQATYDNECKAAIAKDGSAFQKMFDPAFSAMDYDNKKESLADMVSSIASPPAGLTISTCTFAIRKVTLDKKGGAVADVTQTVTGTVAQGKGPAQPFTQIEDSTDAWSLSNPAIQLSANETARRVTIGGQVIIQKGTLATPTP
jgi:hypothetical protein